jgi:molybdate transport system substrate-binding protein
MMKSFCFLAAGAIACLVLLAPARAAEKITVAAAADLKFAMDEIVAEFKASHSADEIGVTYGSSGNLSTRIQQGAPFDIFFSADVGFARALKDKGLAATEPKLYAVGRIVLWSAVRDASKMSLRDLDDPRIRGIAIANLKHAPYGRRAEEALRAVSLWDRLQDKIIFGENIVHTAKYVQSGAVEIGIIALSLAVNRELASNGGYALIADNLLEHFVLDGEAVVLGPDFAALHSGRHNDRAQFYAFDMLAGDGEDQRQLPAAQNQSCIAAQAVHPRRIHR